MKLPLMFGLSAVVNKYVVNENHYKLIEKGPKEAILKVYNGVGALVSPKAQTRNSK